MPFIHYATSDNSFGNLKLHWVCTSRNLRRILLIEWLPWRRVFVSRGSTAPCYAFDRPDPFKRRRIPLWNSSHRKTGPVFEQAPFLQFLPLLVFDGGGRVCSCSSDIPGALWAFRGGSGFRSSWPWVCLLAFDLRGIMHGSVLPADLSMNQSLQASLVLCWLC